MLELALDGLVDGQAGRAREDLPARLAAAGGSAIVQLAAQHQAKGRSVRRRQLGSGTSPIAVAKRWSLGQRQAKSISSRSSYTVGPSSVCPSMCRTTGRNINSCASAPQSGHRGKLGMWMVTRSGIRDQPAWKHAAVVELHLALETTLEQSRLERLPHAPHP